MKIVPNKDVIQPPKSLIRLGLESRHNIVNFDGREDGMTGVTRTEQWSLAPIFGNCIVEENTLGELVRHQSGISVSLVP